MYASIPMIIRPNIVVVDTRTVVVVVIPEPELFSAEKNSA